MAWSEFIGLSGARWRADKGLPLGPRGGFGQVFAGIGGDDSPVAVKVVPLKEDSPQERRRRNRELDIAAKLEATRSRHLLVPEDSAVDGEDLLIVMPRAERSLAAAIQAGLGAEQMRQALQDVTAGLVELEDACVLHRDLKPDNVLWHGGRWKLADFGIARDTSVSTASHTFLGSGTFPYMAPELWELKPATVKSDLYALGVLAFVLLSGGKPPFPGPDLDDFRRQHLARVVPPPPTDDRRLGRLILRLLAKDPASRPQNASLVAQELGAAEKPLPSQLHQLADSALRMTQHEGDRFAEQAAGASEYADAQARVRQAKADLDALLDETADLVRGAVPGVEVLHDGSTWWLRLEPARLGVRLWRYAPKSTLPDDPIVHAGEVLIGPASQTISAFTPEITANVVCEHHGGILSWHLLRFQANAFVPVYEYGPADRPHGFMEHIFKEQRGYMLHQAMHVWTMKKAELTTERLIELFSMAMNS